MRSYYKTELDGQRDLPKSLKKLAKPDEYRKYDLSATEYRNEVTRNRVDEVCVNEYTSIATSSNQSTPIPVNSLTLDEFRNKLVTHFNIAFQKNELKWPRRLKDYEVDVKSS